MKKTKLIIGIAVLCFTILIATGCSGEKQDAVQAMEDYLNHIISGEYGEAYELISDFDKGNISEETFIKWQECVGQIISIESFTIDKGVDVFKDYKYLGTQFGTAYGLKVDRVQTEIIKDVELNAYDKDSYRIMVVKQDDEYKVLLLLSSLDETVAVYEAYLEKLDN